jgi:microcompartment protein CcmK/EutM
LGKVAGTVVSTINHRFYDGKKLLIIDKCDASFEPTGKYLIAVDGIGVGAGVGQRVLVLDEGTGSRQIFADGAAPLRSTVVGIIDEVSICP